MKMSQVLGLQDLYTKFKDKNLPTITNYKLLKLLRSIEVEIDFYKENFTKLLETYGLRDENGNYVKTQDQNGFMVIPDKAAEFQQKFLELLNLDVEIQEVEFALSEFDGANLSLDDLNILFPFIKE